MAITKEKIDRINSLAGKVKTEGLTADEISEQKQLRKEYVESFRENLKSQLDNIRVVDKSGEVKPVSKKPKF